MITPLKTFLPLALMAALLVPACSPGPATGEETEQNPSVLLQALERVPAGFLDHGVWFGDLGTSMARTGLADTLNWNEFMALPEEQRQEYSDALQQASAGIMPPPLFTLSPHPNPNPQKQQWRDTFGFDGTDVRLVVSTGETSQQPLQFAYLEGDFDTGLIGASLEDLGYETLNAGGRTYYTLGEDHEIQLDLFGGESPLMMRASRVFVSDDVLIMGLATEPVVGALQAWAGEVSSLAEDPVVVRLAEALGDPLSAALLSRSVATSTEHKGNRDPLEKQQGWGDLHAWEAMAAGYGTDGEDRSWTFALYYPDAEAAGQDAEELVDRMQGYVPSFLNQLNPPLQAALAQTLFQESCASLTPTVHEHDDGSVLTVRCVLTEVAPPHGWFFFILDSRAVEFLLP